jgi:hypothetical protein
MEMEIELEQFRQEERLRAGRQRGSLSYPEALRAFAVRYLTHALEKGGTFVGAAKALGVSEPTLQPGGKANPQRIGEIRAVRRGRGWCRWWWPRRRSRDGRCWGCRPWRRPSL